jgi:hypothetical protein
MESQLEKTQKCVEDKHRISINIDAQSLQEINTEPQSVKTHKGLYPKLTKACTQNSQRRVPKTHKGLYPKLTKACTQNSQRLVPKTHKGLYPKQFPPNLHIFLSSCFTEMFWIVTANESSRWCNG